MTGIREQLLQHALTYPSAWEDFPWEDDLVVKVRKKIFVFLGTDGSPTSSAGLKLTESLEAALQFDGVEPSGYGLGKHGWVQVPLGQAVPTELIFDWLDESYRAVAPKTLVAQLDKQV
jgi:predicted DNA-binding protein (MmcQ/YjbR family)